MRVGILGSGLMGGKLGTSSREPGTRWCSATPAASRSSRGSHEKPRARRRPAHPREAVQEADAVLLAVHWSRIDDVLKQAGDLRARWS